MVKFQSSKLVQEKPHCEKGQASLVVWAHRKVSIHRPIALQSVSNQSGSIEPASRYPQVTNEKTMILLQKTGGENGKRLYHYTVSNWIKIIRQL